KPKPKPVEIPTPQTMPEFGRQLRLLQSGKEQRVWYVAISPDGRLGASIADDGYVRVWEMASGRQARTMYANAGLGSAVAFSPSSARLLTGGKDGTLK